MPEDEEISELEELFYEGTDLHGEGRYEEAIATFDRCLAVDPDYSDAVLGKALSCLALDRFDEAVTYAKRLVELNPDDVMAHTNLSVVYQRAGMVPEAESAGAKARMLDWKRQLEEDPGDDQRDRPRKTEKEEP